MNSIAIAARTAPVLLLLLAGACEQSHARSGSSGSNWLRCDNLTDCRAAEDAVACEQGYCVDDHGERIAVPTDGGRPPAGDACPWGVDELLREAGAPTEPRGNCGNYPSFRGERAIAAAMDCFANAAGDGNAVELTINPCIDCSIPTTYVATAQGELFAVLMAQDAFTTDAMRSVRVDACADIELAESMVEVVCVDAVELFACEEPLGVAKDPPPPPSYLPLKLADVPIPPGASSVPLHLYVSNQSFDRSPVDIDVYIDGTRVVSGDFDVGGQHNWFEFEIEVPAGMRAVRAFSVDGAAELTQPVDAPAERWAVLDYWYYPGEAEGEHFTLSVHDQPVAFQ